MSGLCQLASEWTGASLPVVSVAELKVDGWRALYLRDWEGRARLYTRNGYRIEGVDHILHELDAWERHAGCQMFLDGEFVVDRGGDTLLSTKQWCETGWRQGGNAGTFHLFDGFPLDQWQAGGSDAPWIERKRRLEALALSVASDEDHAWTWRPRSFGQGEGESPVRLVEHRQVFTAQCVVDHAQEIWNAGGEGVMVKDAEAPYQRNRCRTWLKVKRGQAWARKWNIAA